MPLLHSRQGMSGTQYEFHLLGLVPFTDEEMIRLKNVGKDDSALDLYSQREVYPCWVGWEIHR